MAYFDSRPEEYRAMAKITEVAPDLFRITTFVEPFNLQFSQFLVRDEELVPSTTA